MTLPDISCLVEESLGIQWYFTLSEQQIMEYSRRDKGSWSEPSSCHRPVSFSVQPLTEMTSFALLLIIFQAAYVL